jgi:hypothetical protein
VASLYLVYVKEYSSYLFGGGLADAISNSKADSGGLQARRRHHVLRGGHALPWPGRLCGGRHRADRHHSVLGHPLHRLRRGRRWLLPVRLRPVHAVHQPALHLPSHPRDV